MYIEQAIIRNLKGFRELDFTFKRPSGSFAGWTVLTGDNGSGKSAFLKAIAVACVGPDIARSLQPSWRGWIREGAHKADIAVRILPGDPDRFVTGRRYEQSFWSEVELARNGGPEVTLKPASDRRRGKKGPLNGPWADNTAGWFSAGYGPFRRLYGASTEAQRLMSAPGRIGRHATMFKEDATLGECELWLKELSHRSLEKRQQERLLLEQVEQLLNDDFLRNGLRVKRVDSDGLWLIDARDMVLPLSDMSEGYRAALALMVDLLRHFASVYEGKDLVAAHDDGTCVVPHPGVVLIDEIDAHLHPAWQREIGFWLKQRFPNVQFIVTTHSPLVCQAADPNGIFHLPPPGSTEPPFALSEQDYAKVVRAKADPILLSPAFGLSHTRSPQVVAARQGYARLRAKQLGAHLTSEEQQQLKLWSEQIEPDDPLATD